MPGATYNLVDKAGRQFSVGDDGLADALDAGARLETPQEGEARAKSAGELAGYGDLPAAVEAGIAGGFRGATFGLSDVILRATGDAGHINRLKKANPGVSLATEILGGVLPSIASGGTGTAGTLARLTPSGALSRGAATLGERTAAGAIGRTTISGAVEGGIQNVGSYLSDVALGNKDLSAEGVVGSLGKGALFGGGAGLGLAGAERGTIAARRMFPKLAGGGKEAAQIAEETFHAGAEQTLKQGDELEKVARDHVSQLRIRRKELELEREKLRGNKDPAARLRSKEIALEQEQNRAALKALRDQKNTERSAAGLPDLPPDAPLVDSPVPVAAPANDAAPIAPANDVAPIPPANANAPTDLESQLLGTKQALDEGVPFTEIGKAENDLTIAADNATHEAGMLADGAVDDAINDLARKESKLDTFVTTHRSARDYAAQLKARANQKGTGREVSYRPLQEGSDVLGVGASKRSGKVVTPTGEQGTGARASDYVYWKQPSRGKRAPRVDLEFQIQELKDKIERAQKVADEGGSKLESVDAVYDRLFEYRDDLRKLGVDLGPGPARPEIPPGWVTDDLFPNGPSGIKNRLPSPGKIDETAAYVIHPSELAATGRVYGNPKLSKTTKREIRQEWTRGDSMSPVEAEMDPSGRIWIRDGNHRLSVAAESDLPVVMRIKSRKSLDDVTDSDRVLLSGVGTGSPEPEIPRGFSRGPLSESAEVRAGLPLPGESFNEEMVFVVKAGDLKRAGLHAADDSGFAQNRVESIRDGWKKGAKLDPVKAAFNKEGKLEIMDGRHRMAAASDAQDVAVRIYPYSDDIGMEFGAAGPRAEYLHVAKGASGPRVKGPDLDAAYEQAIEQAAQAATPEVQEEALRRAAYLENQVMDQLATRGGRDAERAAAIRKAREEIGWTPYEVAVRRVEKRLTGEPMTTGRAAGDEAFDAALRRSEMAMGETVGQRADTLLGKRSLADDILAGGRTVEPSPVPAVPSQGRLIDSAEEGIRVFDDYERAHKELVDELGAAAPPAAQVNAQQYAAAIEDQARKQAEAIAMNADKAASTVGLGAPPNVQRLPKLPPGVAGKAADAAAVLELLQSVGDIPFMPDVKNLPVIGPILSMYLKFRGAKAVFNRFGGRIAATAESKAAVRAAELRDRAAGIVDELLEGAGKAAGKAKRPAAVVAVKAYDALKDSLYPDGQERAEPKNAAEATKARVAELSSAVANPDAVRKAVAAQFAASDPDLVNAVANATLRKLQYLQKNAPKEPPPGPLGSKPWHPSAAEIERFARRVRAAEDPTSVLRDLERGTITPEAAETLRVVYPQIFAEVQTRLITRAAELRAELPRQRVLQLSLLFDAPLDPSLEPANMAILQSAHTSASQQPAAPGAPPTPSVAAPVNLSRLYETPEMRRASRR